MLDGVDKESFKLGHNIRLLNCMGEMFLFATKPLRKVLVMERCQALVVPQSGIPLHQGQALVEVEVVGILSNACFELVRQGGNEHFS